jgi:hypothetical protein
MMPTSYFPRGWRADFAVPVRATACCFALILLAFWLAGVVPQDWDGNWTAHIVRLQPHITDRFFPFDAAWYQRIATDGYSWDPTQPGLKQDIAFFPLWPMMLRLAAWCAPTPEGARWITVGMSAAFAFASVCALHRLAQAILPERAVSTAVWLYALYPAASFLLLSYPTGLMNLLCFLAVLATLRGRFWWAALCAGLVTASGPLGLGTAMAVWLCAARGGRTSLHAAARLVGLGALAISGLAGFLLWQFFVLGDAFAFIKAQGAWATPLPWIARIPRAIGQLLILPDFGLGFAYLVHALHARNLVALQAELEKGLHNAALGLALMMCLLCWRRVPRVVKYQGLFTLLLFIWFHSTSRPGNSTLRLTYCAVTTFLGLAFLLQDKPRLSKYAIILSAALLFSAAFLSASGYHVV